MKTLKEVTGKYSISYYGVDLDTESFVSLENITGSKNHFINNCGIVVSWYAKNNNIRVLKGDVTNYYIRFTIKGKKFFAHRLVLSTFGKKLTTSKPYVNHINGIHNDNRIENLEWCTSSENELHSYRVLGKIGKGNTFNKGETHYRSEAVFGIGENNIIEYEYACQKDATKDGFNQALISEVINKKRNFHKGIIWVKKQEYNADFDYYGAFLKNKEKSNNIAAKPVMAYNDKTSIMFKSISEAKRHFEYKTTSSILKALKNKTMCKGFLWKYM